MNYCLELMPEKTPARCRGFRFTKFIKRRGVLKITIIYYFKGQAVKFDLDDTLYKYVHEADIYKALNIKKRHQ